MKKTTTIAFAALMIGALLAQPAWANTKACRIVETISIPADHEPSYLDPLPLGDGHSVPRFVGEKMVQDSVPETLILAELDVSRFFRLQFGENDSCYTSLATCR